MEIIIMLAICFGWSYWCYKIAERNGRDKTTAAVLGFLFGLIAVIIYAVVGKTKELKEKEIQDVVDKRLGSKQL